MGWIVRRLFVVYALFGAVAAMARWRHVPSPWLDGLLAAGAGATLIVMGWRARSVPEAAPQAAESSPPRDSAERALP
jgi:hypothetical protein